MTLPKSELISGDPLRRLLRDTPHRRDDQLSTRLHCDVHILADERVLVFLSGGGARLYGSRTEHLALLDRVAAQASLGPIHPLQELLPMGSDFLARIPDLVRDLPGHLNVDETALDTSEESLRVIDRAIEMIGVERVLTADVFPSLLAYVGEVMRLSTGGRWEMLLDAVDDVWEPWIIDPKGRQYAAFLFYKGLYESDGTSSLEGFVGGQLRGWHLSERSQRS